MERSAQALDIVYDLPPEQIERLDKLPAAAGEHHNEQQMRMIER